jgi:hypothetical protein
MFNIDRFDSSIQFKRLFGRKICNNKKLIVFEYLPSGVTNAPIELKDSNYIVTYIHDDACGFWYCYLNSFKTIEESKEYIESINEKVRTLIHADKILCERNFPEIFVPKSLAKKTGKYQSELLKEISKIESNLHAIKYVVERAE